MQPTWTTNMVSNRQRLKQISPDKSACGREPRCSVRITRDSENAAAHGNHMSEKSASRAVEGVPGECPRSPKSLLYRPAGAALAASVQIAARAVSGLS